MLNPTVQVKTHFFWLRQKKRAKGLRPWGTGYQNHFFLRAKRNGSGLQRKTPKGGHPPWNPHGPHWEIGGKPRREEPMYAFLPPTGSALSAAVRVTQYAARWSACLACDTF